jgi:hypothetical protein
VEADVALTTELETDWWLRAPDLVREIFRQSPGPGTVVRYQLADALLELDSNYRRVLDLIRTHFGDCEAPVSWARDGIRIRCSVRVGDCSVLALVSFAGSQEADGTSMAADRFKYLLGRRHAEGPSPVPGWTLARIRWSSRPFMTRRGYEALIDLSQEPLQHTPGFVHRYVLNATLSTQRDLLFVHAASVNIHGTGVLLMGPAASGKTTVAFALASRGHPLLGEEMAGIRLGSEEVVPIRRTAGIRRGPRARAVAERLEGRHWETEILQEGTERMLVRAGELFPDTGVAPTRLGCAFYLRRLANRVAVERFSPSMTHRVFWQRLSEDAIAVSGASPGRRLMRLFTLMELLSRRRCYFLDVGPPEETAALVEQTVGDEAASDSR